MAYVGNQPARGQFRKLSDISGSFNGATTTFTTSVPPGTSEFYVTAGSASQLIVSLGGVIQQPDTDYTVSTNSITFTTAPAAGLSFFGVLLGDALNSATPSDGSITAAKLAGNLTAGFAGGSAGSPSIYFTGDTNTGIYSPGADQVAISTNGTARVTVNSSGSVGIGTNAPSSLLHLEGSDGVAQIRLQRAGTNIYGIIRQTSAPYGLTYDAVDVNTGSPTHAFRTSTDGSTFSERARIDSSGRLLVGTSTSASSGYAQYAKVQVNASTLGSSVEGVLALTHGISASTSIPAEEGVGIITFANGAGGEYARIRAVCDGTSSSASDLPGRLVFSTTADGASSPTERMRIKNNGETWIVPTLYGLVVSTAAAAGTTYTVFEGLHSGGSVGSGTLSFRVFSNGNVQNTNNSYGIISDAKVKENIVDASSQWSDIKGIRIRNFNLKPETGYQTHRQIGVIAQEVEEISPGLVYESPDRDEDGNDLGTVTKGVHASVLYMKAVKALQEAMERIEQLEAKVAALETA